MSGHEKPLLKRKRSEEALQPLKTKLYAPLDQASKTIRLLRIFPGVLSDDMIVCELFESDLARDDRVPYKALSYAWLEVVYGVNPADRNKRRDISCNGQAVSVGENLFRALRRIRNPDSPVIFWIDAICINQADVAERTHQVSFMRLVYEGASEVVVWLGDRAWDSGNLSKEEPPLGEFENYGGSDDDDDDDDGDDGRSMAIERLIDSKCGHDFFVAERERVAFGVIYLLSQGRPLKEQSWKKEHYLICLWYLTQSSWWSRIWVVQEVAVARRVTVRYGNVAAPWSMFCRAARNFWRNSVYRGLDSRVSGIVNNFARRVEALELLRDDRLRNRPTGLLKLLRSSRPREASDARDKVFALLGLAQGHGIKVDYSLSCEEVFRSTATSLIEKTQTLEVLTGSQRLRTTIFSWVADWAWTTDPEERLDLLHLYDAVRGRSGLVRTHGNGVLEVQAFCVDIITRYSGWLDEVMSPIHHYLINEKWLSASSPDEKTTSALARTMRGDLVHEVLNQAEHEEGVFRRSRVAYRDDWIHAGSQQDELPPEGSPNVEFSTTPIQDDHTRAVSINHDGRVVFETKAGRLGMGPARRMGPGDLVCLVLGSRVPLVLRRFSGWRCKCKGKHHEVLIPAPEGGGPGTECPGYLETYDLVGDAYVDGIMDGQGLDSVPVKPGWTGFKAVFLV